MHGNFESAGGEAERFPPAALRADLIAHPEFPAAAERAARAVTDLYRGNWLLNRLLNDRGRFLVALVALDLHAFGPPGGEPGLTIGRLRRECADLAICSPGRCNALAAFMRVSGLLAVSAGSDRRVRRLEPTAKFLSLHRARLEAMFAAAAGLLPLAHSAAEALRDRPEFLREFVHAQVDLLRTGARLLEATPSLAPIAERDVGIVVLLFFFRAAGEGREATIAEAARRFSVSRGHNLTILREAERQGFVRRGMTRREDVAVEPALTGAIHDFLAAMFLVQDHATRRAMARTGGGDFAASRIASVGS